MKQSQENACLSLFEVGVIRFGKFTVKYGDVVDVYFDLNRIIGYPSIMNDVCSYLGELIEENHIKADYVCGVSYSGIPFASMVSYKTNIPLLMRRKEKRIKGKSTIKGLTTEGKTKSKCVIVEEVIASGYSILETIKDMEASDVVVRDVIVVVDRDQGGIENLRQLGYNVHCLINFSEMGEFLKEKRLISDEQFKQIVLDNKEKFSINGYINTAVPFVKNVKTPYSKRAKESKCAAASRLFNLMLNKRTNLTVELIMENLDDVINLSRLIGPYISLLVIYSTLLPDHERRHIYKLKKIAIEYNFMLMDNRKLCDTDNVAALQFNRIIQDVDFITVHALPGTTIMDEIWPVAMSHSDKGLFIYSDIDVPDSLTTSKYRKEAIELGKSNPNIVAGFISLGKVDIPSEFVHIMPDLHTTTCIKRKEHTKYTSINSIINNCGADSTIVTFEDHHIVSLPTIIKYRDLAWSAYQNRIRM